MTTEELLAKVHPTALSGLPFGACWCTFSGRPELTFKVEALTSRHPPMTKHRTIDLKITETKTKLRVSVRTDGHPETDYTFARARGTRVAILDVPTADGSKHIQIRYIPFEGASE